MNRASLCACVASFAACFAAACSSSSSSDATTPPATGGIPCDVENVLASGCRTCHGSTPQFGAPMSLVTYGDLVAPAKSDPTKRVYELVAARIADDAKPMPPAPNARLGTNDRASLANWAAAGAPSSDTTCPAPGAADGGAPPAPPGAVSPLSCTPDVSMKPASPWAMPETTDDVYVCYGFDVTAATKRHLVAIAPKIDNSTIVHHLVLFQTPNAYSSTPQPCDEASSVDWRIVFGWAPGGGNFEFPPEAGYPEEGTTHYVVQMHYNNVRHLAGQNDSSGFDFCTTDKLRPNDAGSVVFGTTNFSIPPRGSLDITCGVQIPTATPPVHVSAFPHMHQIGTSIATVALPGGTGAPVDLGAKPHWDFQSQTYVPVNATLSGGDLVQTRCAWSNPTDKAVSFGPYTEDEMCFSFTFYYPAINASESWLVPSETSKCAPTN